MNKLTEKKIANLKMRRSAVILAHNYQLPEIQDIADFVGDSLDLSLKAKETTAETIVFCGVHFMAETAKLLSPFKKVLIPDPKAGCPMADMIDEAKLAQLKKKYPLAKVVSYVNTTARVKAMSDICCTSANAAAIVENLDADDIIFVPDRNLADYVSGQTWKNIIPFEGYCHVHVRITRDNILLLKELHPQAEVLAHPECTKDVKDIADQVLSTTGMCGYAGKSTAKEMIIATEVGILHRLKAQNPGKMFFAASEAAVCENMKKITLDKVLLCLEEMKHEVQIESAVAVPARKALDDMLLCSRKDGSR